MIDTATDYLDWRSGVLVTPPTVVYFLYADNELLYIGRTKDLEARLRQHWRNRPWMPQVTRIETVGYASREAARIAEKHYILELQPRYNEQGKVAVLYGGI
jgi:excinuclease UvrABC nuclease subunit